MKKRFIVANWKMYLDYQQAIASIKNFERFSPKLNQEIIICPPFTVLNKTQSLASIKWGAQDCSQFEKGAYTGQIDAHSLSQLGCSYCIVGHNETRNYFHQTSQDILEKVKQLFRYNITPIICIGEAQKQSIKTTIELLSEQLEPLTSLNQQSLSSSFIIAYEPSWSIGTGNVADTVHLNNIAVFIREYLATSPLKGLLYGGSVSDQNIHYLEKELLYNGYLIGKASTDFQIFKNIVFLI